MAGDVLTPMDAGLIVLNAEGATVRAVPTGRRPAVERSPADLILGCVAEAGLRRVGDVVIDAFGSARSGSFLRVPLGPGEGSVVLLEQDSVLSWHTPERDTTVAPGLRKPGTAIFRLNEDGAAATADRQVMRAVAFTYGGASAMAERNFRPSLVDMQDADPATWGPATALSPPAPNARLLLLLHGGLSTTVGSFGALAATADGRSFLADARRNYDRILGFDHATLGATPEHNSIALAEALRTAGYSQRAQLDIIAFGTSGPLARLMAERPRPGAPAVRRVVFVGAANGGLALAQPSYRRRYLDITTNLVAATGDLLAGSGATLVRTILAGAVRPLGGFARTLAGPAEATLPGLVALQPGSDLITGLNASPGSGGARYVSLGAAFDPARSLKPSLARWMAAGNAPAGSSDMVVDTAAMSSFGGQAGQLDWSRTLLPEAQVHHGSYFLSRDTIALVREGLALPSFGPEVRQPRRSVVDYDPFGLPEPVPTRSIKPPSEPPTCHFGAAMPDRPPLGRASRLDVTVAREAITLPEGMASAQAAAPVQPGEQISVEIVPRFNCAVRGVDRASFDVPALGKPEEMSFDIEGQESGPAELWVDARQGARRLIRLVLQPHFVEVRTMATAAAVASTASADPPSVAIRILEIKEGQAAFRLRFLLESRDLGLNLDEESSRFEMGTEAYVTDLYDRLEGNWGTGLGFEAFMSKLRAFGADLYAKLVPMSVQRTIWDNRARIGSIEVISEEPFIPWEVLHIVEPGEPMPLRGNAFLAELGLTRWISNAGWPPSSLRVRPGKARYVVPDYPLTSWKLPYAQTERTLLQDLFAATEIVANSRPVLEILSEPGGFDLLHFACHGMADSDRIWNAALAMMGSVRADGTPEQDLIDVPEVHSYSRLTHPDGGRPIVFLNACQAGKTGRTLTGTGGMADAFVRRGAGLFVGTLWSVADATASVFARKFYEALKAQNSVAQATRIARTAAREASDPTWLAYVVYGHAYGRLSAG